MNIIIGLLPIAIGAVALLFHLRDSPSPHFWQLRRERKELRSFDRNDPLAHLRWSANQAGLVQGHDALCPKFYYAIRDGKFIPYAAKIDQMILTIDVEGKNAEKLTEKFLKFLEEFESSGRKWESVNHGRIFSSRKVRIVSTLVWRP